MITRAIVEEVSDTKARVRIPIFHGAKSSSVSTPTADLPWATICVLPNEIPGMQVGDVVFVGFEDWDSSRPVILGYLYGSKEYTTKCALSLDSLHVEGISNLGATTNIGEVTSSEIECLKGLVGSVQGQLNMLSDRISVLEKGE